MHDDNVYLGLGSNVGDRNAHLRAGLVGLCEGGLRLRTVSSFYLTEPDLRPPPGVPIGPHNAADRAGAVASAHPQYVNCVAAFEAELDPRDLLKLCLEVEIRQGRERPSTTTAGPQPRTLDIDVLMIGQRIVDEPGLTVPHPLMMQRRFVLQPLAEIAPALRHPLVPGTIDEALARLTDGYAVEVLEPPPVGAF